MCICSTYTTNVGVWQLLASRRSWTLKQGLASLSWGANMALSGLIASGGRLAAALVTKPTPVAGRVQATGTQQQFCAHTSTVASRRRHVCSSLDGSKAEAWWSTSRAAAASSNRPISAGSGLHWRRPLAEATARNTATGSRATSCRSSLATSRWAAVSEHLVSANFTCSCCFSIVPARRLCSTAVLSVSLAAGRVAPPRGASPWPQLRRHWPVWTAAGDAALVPFLRRLWRLWRLWSQSQGPSYWAWSRSRTGRTGLVLY